MPVIYDDPNTRPRVPPGSSTRIRAMANAWQPQPENDPVPEPLFDEAVGATIQVLRRLARQFEKDARTRNRQFNAKPRRGTQGFQTPPEPTPAPHREDQRVRGTGEWQDPEAEIVHMSEQVETWGKAAIEEVLGIPVPDTRWSVVGPDEVKMDARTATGAWVARSRGRGTFGTALDRDVSLEWNPVYVDEYKHRPTGVVLHEATHAAMTQGFSAQWANKYDEEMFWIHEGLADYVALKVLGRETATQNVVGSVRQQGRRRPRFIEPVENGYHSAARFFYWLDEQYPGAVVDLAQEVAGGARYGDLDRIMWMSTGQSLWKLQARYYAESGDWAP